MLWTNRIAMPKIGGRTANGLSSFKDNFDRGVGNGNIARWIERQGSRSWSAYPLVAANTGKPVDSRKNTTGTGKGTHHGQMGTPSAIFGIVVDAERAVADRREAH